MTISSQDSGINAAGPGQVYPWFSADKQEPDPARHSSKQLNGNPLGVTWVDELTLLVIGLA